MCVHNHTSGQQPSWMIKVIVLSVLFQAMDGDFPDPAYNMPPGAGYGYPHDGFDYNQPMDYSHEAGYDFHHGDPGMQPLGHPPARGGTWYDTDL